MAGHGKGRLLTVAGMRYRWNLRDGQQYLLLTVVGSETTRQARHVLLRHDNVWLHFSDLAHSGQAAEEPGLVIRSIKPPVNNLSLLC